MADLNVFAVQSLVLAETAGANQELIAAVTGTEIHVLAVFGVFDQTTRFHATSDATGGISDTPTAAGTMTRMSFPPGDGKFAYLVVAAGKALQVDVGATGTLDGTLFYRLVPTAAGA